jgi:DNA-binding NarL/FixJ family response regulator
MEKKIMLVLIVTRSIALQQGLGALLESLPGIATVKAIRELPEAYNWIESHQPTIVLLDASLLGNNPHVGLEKILSISPASQRVLLVDDVQDLKFIPRDAEAILIKGGSPSVVAVTVTNLLSSKVEEYQSNQ